MNHEYTRKTPIIRFAFLAAALSVTLSIGGFIEILSTPHLAASAPVRLAVATR